MTIASIDIGTNTILLLIVEADLETKSFTLLRNEHRMPRIGKGVKTGIPISDEKIKLLKSILHEYKVIIESYGTEKVILTGTNIFRIASNSSDIINQVYEEFNYRINVISGDEEAYYSFLGATSGINDYNDFLIIDIGGGSTEIISGSRENIRYKKSFQVGAVSAREMFFLSDPPTAEQVGKLEIYLNNLFIELWHLSTKGKYPLAIAGTPTTLSAIKHNLTNFNEKIIELSELNILEIKEIIDNLSTMTSTEIRKKYPKIMLGREDIILAGSIILLKFMQITNLNKVYTSTKGIRYGAVVKFLMEN